MEKVFSALKYASMQ